MAQQHQHAAAISLDIASSISAAGTTSALAAVTQALQSVTNGRDPMLEAFEQHLLNKLKASDAPFDSEGIRLFNANQTAYAIEGSSTKEQKSSTRERVAKAICSKAISHVMKRQPVPGPGWPLQLHCCI
jgi:hypothetical protein